jgi:lipoprotein NlpI
MRKFLIAAALGLAAGLTVFSSVAQQPEFREVKVAEGAFSRGDPPPPWVDPLPVPPEERGKPLIVRLADNHYLAGERPAVFVNRAVQVNDAAALGYVGQLPIHFVPEYQRLKLHAMRLLRGGQTIDKTHTVNLRFLQRETGLEQGVYSGVVSAVVLVDDLRVGDTLHVMYTVEGDNPVLGGRYAEFSMWDNAEPIKLRRVTLNYPKDRPIQWKLLGQPGAPVEPEVSEAGGLRRLRFVGRDIPAVVLEPQLPESYQAFRVLQFSEYRSWNEVARWALPLFKPSAQLSDEALAVVERVRALPSREARIGAALQWVQSEIRYFSVSLGESSHRPHAPNVVLARRYGDCKDKSLLLISLLHQLGIDAKPVLVSAGSKTTPENVLPTPLAFDHVIVEVNEGGRAFYLDPTRLGQRGRLARMGQPLDGAQVLVVGAETSELTRIATPNITELVRSEIEERITVENLSGEGVIEVRRTYNGAQAEGVRLMLPQLSPAQVEKFAMRGFERRYPDAALLSEPQVSDDAERNSIVVVTRFKSSKASVAAPQRWLVPVTAPNFGGAFPMPEVLRRSLPLGIPTHPYEGRYTLEVLWPKNVSAMRDPYSQRIDNKHFNFASKGSFRGNRAHYEFTLRTRTHWIEPSELQAAYDDIRKVSNLASNIFLTRSEVREVIRFTRRSLQDTLRERLQESVERTSKTIAGGGLGGGDLAEALCTRSETYAELGKTAEAIQDGKEAVRVTPNKPDALACRANAFWHAGQFEHAIADYSRALALGHSQFRSFYRRGHARFYLGKLEEAASDFEKAVATGDGDKLYAELWLAWTLKRLGRELPADLVERARGDARGAWPRPALAMLAGALSPEEVLKELERLKGDEREMALTEGWFYIGQNYLTQKQAAAAREAFAKAREKGVIVYIEHVAAGFELGKINSD